MKQMIVHVVDILMSIFKLYICYNVYVFSHSILSAIGVYAIMTLFMIYYTSPFIKIDYSRLDSLKEQIDEAKKNLVDNYWTHIFPYCVLIYITAYLTVNRIYLGTYLTW